MKALLDVNVLIALLDSNHLHHVKATRWLESHGELGWSSCAITINGCVRIMSNAAYPNAMPVAQVMARLREASEHAAHEYLHCQLNLLDPSAFEPVSLLTSSQITDAYLLGLACAHGHRLVTFDAKLNLASVRGATSANLLVL